MIRPHFVTGLVPALTIMALWMCGCTPSAQATEVSVAPPAEAAHVSMADQQMLSLLEEDLDAQRRFNPISASSRGDRRFDDRLPDVSDAGRARELRDARDRLERARSVNPDELSPDQQLNRRLLIRELEHRISAAAYQQWQRPVTQLSGPSTLLARLPDQLSFNRDKHYTDYLRRLEGIPMYLDQVMANMRLGLAEGRTPPRVIMTAVPDQAQSLGDDHFLAAPTEHPLYQPFIDRDDAVARRARQVIAEDIVPAFQRFADFLRQEYVPNCRVSIGTSAGPDGIDYYEHQIRHYTTLDLTADEVHVIGRSEVARIRAEMMGVIRRTDFAERSAQQGDALFEAFVNHLRTDPRFYYDSADELLAGYRDIAKQIDAQMPLHFGRLPRLPYGIRAMPELMAPTSPTAYYFPGSIENGVAGYFVANTYALDQRPKYEMIALTLHEAVPGHHHQIAIAQELKTAGLPEWRDTVDSTAYVEGWALYCERLGLEMGEAPYGLYNDPYDDFGRLSYEMWRALRLVVDTGIHAMDWSRQQAIDYMLENSALTRTNIEREVDRYISWPGQALAYKIGEIRIRELRELAERELGSAFDRRAFHDALLWQGPLPLEVLTEQMSVWIAGQQRSAGATRD